MEITFDTYKVETMMANFLLRGDLQPRGDLMVFLNDQTYSHFTFDEAELLPLATGYQVRSIRQPAVNVNRDTIAFISALEEGQADKVQILQSKRPVVFYTELLAIRGYLHVNPDMRDDDLLDQMHDFFAITGASIFPLRSLANTPRREVPFLAVNRNVIFAYHVDKPEASG